MGFVAPKEERVKGGFVAPRTEIQPDKPGFLSKANQVAGNVVQTGLDVLNAPFEVVGEALRLPMEGAPISDFRAPTIIQRGLENSMTASNPPANPFTQVNKGLRSMAGAAQGLPGGIDSAIEGGKAAYNADRGMMGPIEDMALGVVAGKFLPQVANAPMDAAVKGGKALVRGAEGILPSIGRKAIRAGLGPTEEATSAMFKNPEAIKAATNIGPSDIAHEIAGGHKTVTDKIKTIEEEVSKVLRPSPYLMEGATPKDKVLQIIKTARKDIGFTVTPQQKYVKEILDGISDNLKQLRETVSEVQLRDLVQKVTDAVKYGKKEYSGTDIPLMKVRKSLDTILKKNLDYAALMEKEVPLQRLADGLEDSFGLKRSVGEGFVATDTTASKLNTILGETKEVRSQEILKNLSKETGVDYIQKVKDHKMAQQFVPGVKRSEGSARTLLGGALGTSVGGVAGGWGGAGIGSAAGGLAGRGLDYYGGSVAGKIIEALSNGNTKVGGLLKSLSSGPNKTPFRELLQQILKNPGFFSPLASSGAGREARNGQ